MRIDLTAMRGTADAPVIIDGNHAATFTGASQFKLRARHMVLRALRFENAAAAPIIITTPDTRITETEFVGCGDATRPQAECLLIMEDAARTELDFNTFVGSLDVDQAARRRGRRAAPAHRRVVSSQRVSRHVRRFSNGQEPIQVAGPGGGGSNVALRTRIEHNLFYRANGDIEAISIKTPGLMVRWNAFRDMDAAPNLRGIPDNMLGENVLVRTRPIRIAGLNNLLVGNILLCLPGASRSMSCTVRPAMWSPPARHPRQYRGGQQGRRAVHSDTQPLDQIAHDNEVVANVFHLSKPDP